MTPYLPSCKEAGSGPLLLFLHGLGGNRHSFDAQFEHLSQHYRCVAWDVPGYGGSEPLPEMTFEALAACVDSLVEHLQATPRAVIGHSLGGMIAQSWIHQGGACEKLILAQTSARFGKPGSSFNKSFLAARLAPIEAGQAPADFAEALITTMFFDPSKRTAIEAAIATMAPLPAAVYRQVIECLVTFDEADTLSRITQPTLCLAASDDSTAPAKAMQAMAAQLPNGSFKCLQAAGHLAYAETPAAFSQAIVDFAGTP